MDDREAIEGAARARADRVPRDAILLTEATILSVESAATALGGRRDQARQWLRDNGMVRHLPGWAAREVVVWGDVLAFIRAGGAAVEVAAPRASSWASLPSAGKLDRKKGKKHGG